MSERKDNRLREATLTKEERKEQENWIERDEKWIEKFEKALARVSMKNAREDTLEFLSNPERAAVVIKENIEHGGSMLRKWIKFKEIVDTVVSHVKQDKILQ